jgi:two-component system OmpR family response regulator
VSPHILVVDDDPVIVRLLEVNFRLDGFDVSTAGRGEEAIELAVATPPDIILLDIMMPGLDGYQVCRRLREIPALTDIPVLFLSARAKDDAGAVGEDLGFVDYVTKPFDPTDLVATVRRLLEGSPS